MSRTSVDDPIDLRAAWWLPALALLALLMFLALWGGGSGAAMDVGQPINLTATNETRFGMANSFWVDGNGTIYVTDNSYWWDGSSYFTADLRMSGNDGRTFSPPMSIPRLDCIDGGGWHLVGTDGNGTIYLAGRFWRWEYEDMHCNEGLLLARSFDMGRSFLVTEIFYGAFNYSEVMADDWMFFSPDGAIYCLWSVYDSDSVYYHRRDPLWITKSVDGGTSFLAPKMLLGGMTDWVDVAMDGNGRMYGTWQEWDPERNITKVSVAELSYEKGAPVNSVQIASEDGITYLAPYTIVASGDGIVHVLWSPSRLDYHIARYFPKTRTVHDAVLDYTAQLRWRYCRSLLASWNGRLCIVGVSYNCETRGYYNRNSSVELFWMRSEDDGRTFSDIARLASPVGGYPTRLSAKVTDEGILYVSWGVEYTVSIPDPVRPCNDPYANFLVKLAPWNGPPRLVLSLLVGSSTVSKSETIVLDASRSVDPEGEPITFEWTSNISGRLGEGPRLETRLPPGRHLVTVLVRDAAGNSASAAANLTVVDRAPVAVISSPMNGTACHSWDDVLFDAGGSYDPDDDRLSFFWSSESAALRSEQATFTRRLPLGRHLVSLEVKDGDGLVSRAWVVVEVLDAPPTAVLVAERLVVGRADVIHFDGSASYDIDGLLAKYYFDFGDGSSASGLVTCHAYQGTGDFIVTLTVKDSTGLTGCASLKVTVRNRPPAADIGLPRAPCAGTPARFEAIGVRDPDGQVVGCAWDFGDGGTASGMEARHSFAGGGQYLVTLRVRDNDGGETVTSKVVQVEGQEVEVGPSPWAPLLMVLALSGASCLLFRRGLRRER